MYLFGENKTAITDGWAVIKKNAKQRLLQLPFQSSFLVANWLNIY